MTDKHDFKAAREAYFATIIENLEETEPRHATDGYLSTNELEAIDFALRLAEKLMEEPSDDAFKAMRDQLIKEVENG